ncbi:MAG: type II secretion system F family protein [Acidobacteriota bacterium]
METTAPFLTTGHAVIGIIFFSMAFLDVMLLGTPFGRWWNKYIDAYAGMLSHELDFMFVDIDKRLCKILLNLGVAVAAIAGFALFGVLGGLASAVIGLLVPRLAIRVARDMRMDMFDVQLIDVVTMIKNSLKSGLGLQQAFEMVANEFTAPASQEMALVLKEIRMGLDIDEALENLVKRVPNRELEMVVTSIVTLRKTGGNMVETFELIVYTIKERKKVEGKIKALTAQGKTQTRILLAMPFVMAGILTFMNPEFMSPLFNTILGWVFLTIIGMMMTTGYFVIRKLTTIEI